MMRQYELVERVLNYEPDADEDLLNRAYVYAMKAHGQQKRKSGDPYFTHPLEVAAILTDLKLDAATIATALLHDVIEDTPTTRAEIDHMFGTEIGVLVDGLTKIKRLDLVSKEVQQAENFRKLLIAISTDVRVLLVKLADRLHNMRTMEHMSPGSRVRISKETIDIYAPLAGRMGMNAMREELEALAFEWLEPEAYKTVTKRLGELHQKNEGLVEEIRGILDAKLAEAGISGQVSGRAKRAYSIWRKMRLKKISLEQFSDIYGFRIIVDTIDDCYRVLGVVHQEWKTVPGRFKDYISTPKTNGYRSIHTTVAGPRYQRLELQLRTRDMHEIAEYGIAAHALYKEGAAGPSQAKLKGDLNPYAELRKMVNQVLEGAASEEVLEHTKLELFHDQVFCFTPKGRLIALPRGATALDFAFAVHTDVGAQTVSALVNGRRVPVDTRLRNGDEVEAITSATHTIPTAWEGFVVTGRARSAIRRIVRETVRRQYSGLGKHLLVTAFEKEGYSFELDALKSALPRLGHGNQTVDDVMAKVARNEIPVQDVMRALMPGVELKHEAPAEKPKNRYSHTADQEGWFNLSQMKRLKFRANDAVAEAETEAVGAGVRTAVPIRGLASDLPVSFEEGGAVPGDRIVGVVTPDNQIRIFQIHSPKLRAYEHEKWIDVAWDINHERPERFPARISVTTRNEPGTLAQIAQLIGEEDANIDHLRMISRGADFTNMALDIEVWDLDHLNHILSGLKGLMVVSEAERIFE